MILLVSGALHAACQQMPLKVVASGISVAQADHIDGFTANLGVIKGPRGTVIFDTGPGRHVADRLLCARIGEVVAVINSHSHPENVLGNSSFSQGRMQGRTVPIIATSKTRELMMTRCPTCRRRFVEAIGARVEALTTVVLPNQTINARGSRKLGGRRMIWLPFEGGHIPGNAALFDIQSRTLFAGGLVVSKTIPDTADADVGQWLESLGVLSRMEPLHVVADHGEIGDRRLIDETIEYLKALRDDARAGMQAGVDLSEIELSYPGRAFQNWSGFTERHGSNLRRELLRQERAWLQPR